MRGPRVIGVVASVLIGGAFAHAQPADPSSEVVPVPLVLEDLRQAYSVTPTADEVTVKFREHTSRIVVRVEPEPGASALRRVLLELESLRVFIGEGVMIVTSDAAPGKYYQTPFDAPINAETILAKLPPVPAPQLVFAAAPDPDKPLDLPPYLREVAWSNAVARPAARPPIVVMGGSARSGPVAVIVDVQTGRLTQLMADFASPEGEKATLELSFRPLAPGDPKSWRPDVAGRAIVSSLGELAAPPLTAPDPLTPAVPNAPASEGKVAPELPPP